MGSSSLVCGVAMVEEGDYIVVHIVLAFMFSLIISIVFYIFILLPTNDKIPPLNKVTLFHNACNVVLVHSTRAPIFFYALCIIDIKPLNLMTYDTTKSRDQATTSFHLL